MKKVSLFFLATMLCVSAPSWAAELSFEDLLEMRANATSSDSSSDDGVVATREPDVGNYSSDGAVNDNWREEQYSNALCWELKGNHLFDKRNFDEAWRCFLKAGNLYPEPSDFERLRDARKATKRAEKFHQDGVHASFQARYAEEKEERVSYYEHALACYKVAGRTYREGMCADKIAKVQQALDEAQGDTADSDEVVKDTRLIDASALFTTAADGKNALMQRYLKDNA